MEIEENEALTNVAQLIDLASGLGQASQAERLIMICRKLAKGREMRKRRWSSRGDTDNWAARKILEEALSVADNLVNSFPYSMDRYLEP